MKEKLFYKTLTFLLIIFISLNFNLCALFPHTYTQNEKEVENLDSQQFLTIHVIAHTHDDVGWLKNVDQYYYGANNSIQNAGVQYILDSVIVALEQNPERKFVYVEIAFFQRWWDEQDEPTKTLVRSLVARGQLEFINGGWCMNDEATTHHEDIIDQMTEGHEFLQREFGVRPRIGWSIDPFGHASTQATLFAKMGFDAYFFARIDYQDYDLRKKNKQLEFVWRPSQSFGNSVEIWTHSMFDGTYCYAPDMGYESWSDPVQDDPRLFDYNVNLKADEFALEMRKRELAYQTNQIFLAFGCDFQFQNAIINFKNIEKLMSYVNSNKDKYNMEIIYSNPSQYVDAVHQANQAWPIKTDDFFPYADFEHAYWTGYFTSRPSIKGYVRSSANELRSVEKLFSSSPFSWKTNVSQALERIDGLTKAMGVLQHHDAVAGTEKQHVANDYAKRLSMGTSATRPLMIELLTNLLANETVSQKQSKMNAPSLSFCPLLNVSVCPAASNAFTQGKPLAIVAYNPLAWSRNDYYASIPVPFSQVTVYDSNGKVIVSQTLPNPDTGAFNVVFQMYLPPMGYNTYFVMKSTSIEHSAFNSEDMINSFDASDIVITNDFYSLTFSEKTNLLTQVTDLSNKLNTKTIKIEQDFLWYNGSTGNDDSYQTSGAYIFRPNGTNPFTIGKPSLTWFKGPCVQEVRQVWPGNWVSQITRLWTGVQRIEFSAAVGTIPINDGLGKEIITRFTTNLTTNDLFYTDSEAEEMQERRRDYRPTWNLTVNEPVAGNYYPINAAAFIRDQQFDSQLTIVTDRSCGGGSIKSGQLEVMLHRRLLVDDFRGVGEPLNETEQIRTTQFVHINNQSNSSNLLRTSMLLNNNAPILTFGSVDSGLINDWINNYQLQFNPLVKDLPANVHLMTFKPLANGEILLRLHNIYAVGEDAQLSKSVSIDLSNLFKNLIPLTITEVSITNNQILSKIERLQWKTIDNKNKDTSKKLGDNSIPLAGSIVQLDPMQIRTFRIRYF
eukprot:TRINITY_DN81_c0_g2_i1.p1 TRINITY_DN81_c0_g2~~TRINITY_DN81_c0_g2_i1.p1  ORF type:complete len:1006 (+),score=459.80 TRINITY_DN81_c0_g2_i1:78-3095(+)